MDEGERIERLARGFNRTTSDIEQQLADADTPRAETVRRMERRLARLQHAVLTDTEAAELDDMAAANRRRYEQQRALRDARERSTRQQLTLGARLDRALAQAVTLAAANPASPQGRITGTKEHHGPPRPPGGLLAHVESVNSVHERYRIVLAQFVARLEQEIDAATIYQLGGEQKVLTTQERDDKLLRDWEGVRSEIVSVLAPEFGTPRAVEKARHRNARRPIDGTRLQSTAAAA